jgi:SAM-dependent methyltransferase
MKIVDQNQVNYNSRHVVFAFSRRKRLQPAEESIAGVLSTRLGEARMLDLGVGAGRTAHYFLPRTLTYLGLDYAPRMVAACRKRFQERRDSFRVGDARELGHFPAGSFDFVLFSDNGLDSMGHVERMGVLRQVRRILSPHGSFGFSSHSAFGLGQLNRALVMRLLNDKAARERARNDDHFTLRETPRGHTYHIRPAAQLGQLAEAGWRRARVFGVDGRELQQYEIFCPSDPWLYYLCE